jgi:hypothetical protein
VFLKDYLLDSNQRGIFPGPDEQYEAFLKRAQASVSTQSEKEAFTSIKTLFGAVPDWVAVQFGAKELQPWEGAAAWIDENEDGVRTVQIQIKSALSSFYSQKEMLAHELVHAMRLHFEESRFEEILAYQTSTNRFRRYFGPFFSKPWEIKGFFTLLLASWLVFWSELLLERDFGGSFVLWVPWLVMGLGFVRLVRSQRIFAKALRTLRKVLAEPWKALAVALRLSDAEIVQFAQSTSQEARDYIEKNRMEKWRWQMLFEAYFSTKVPEEHIMLASTPTTAFSSGSNA